MCPCDTWTMENVIHDRMNSRVRGSFLSVEGNQTIWWVRGERKERRKKEKKRKKRKKKKGKKNKIEEEEDLCMEEKKNGSDSRCSEGRKSLV